MSNQNLEKTLKHPIPQPTYDQQYRAIGLVWGIYQPKAQLTRGEMILSETVTLETVLLGKAINVVKKHINLEDPHLWVVYPRTRQKNDYLHLQIVGVWEPDTLRESSQRAEQLEEDVVSQVSTQAGYFSIRGEVIFYSEAEQKIIVKIRRATSQKPNFFKLRLNGILSDEKEKLGWFWDLDVQLKGDELVVTEGKKIAPISNKPKHPILTKSSPSEKNQERSTPKKIISTAKEKPSPTQKKPKPIPRQRKQRSREEN